MMLETQPLTELISELKDVITEVNPQTLYVVHGGDIHSDHGIVFNATVAACKPFNQTIGRIVSYEFCFLLKDMDELLVP